MEGLIRPSPRDTTVEDRKDCRGLIWKGLESPQKARSQGYSDSNTKETHIHLSFNVLQPVDKCYKNNNIQQLLVTQPRATGNAPPRLLSNAHLRSAQRRMAPILDSKGDCLLRIFSNSTAVSICTMITYIGIILVVQCYSQVLHYVQSIWHNLPLSLTMTSNNHIIPLCIALMFRPNEKRRRNSQEMKASDSDHGTAMEPNGGISTPMCSAMPHTSTKPRACMQWAWHLRERANTDLNLHGLKILDQSILLNYIKILGRCDVTL